MKKTHNDFVLQVKKLVGEEYTIVSKYEGSNINLKMKHNKCGITWSVRPSNFLRKKNGTRCPNCSGLKKKSESEIKDEILELTKGEYSLIGTYVNTSTPTLMRHNKCGRSWMVRISDFKSKKNRCPHCYYETISLNIKKTTRQFKEEVFNKFGDEYIILGEYKAYNESILMRHKCGNKIKIRPVSLMRKKVGSVCSKCLIKTTDEFKKDLHNKFKNDYVVLSKYKGENKILNIQHKKCGSIIKITPKKILNSKLPLCKECYPIVYKKNGAVNKRTIEQFKEEIYALEGDNYSVETKILKNSSTPIKILHKKCGKSWRVRPTDFLKNNGNRCPTCSMNRTSNLESELIEFIESIYDGKIITSATNILKGRKELDIFIPDKNLAIEFNGLYWHSEKGSQYRCDINYHSKKTIECEEKGIQLLHIFENEWNDKKDIIKSKITYLLQSDKLERIYARKCKTIREIIPEQKKIFLNETHIQGNDKSIINFGLFKEDDLVAVMTFAVGRANRGMDVLELSRYSTKLNSIVIGGFSKMFSYFIREYDTDEFENKIYSYADLRYSYGNLYIRNGWKLENRVKPSYSYVKNNKVYHKSSFKKSNIKIKFPNVYSNNKTESEMMKELKFDRIFDSGKLKFVYLT